MPDEESIGQQQVSVPSTPTKQTGARDREIVRASVIGIMANVLLAAFKAAVGLISHSIAIVLDAVNNLSDALSSIITIIGTKLASKPPDRTHPYGHGRSEYITTIVISVIVIYAGVSSLQESVERIIEPQMPSYDTITLVVVAAAVVTKIVLGRYVKSVGKRVGSDSLVASGTDALMDSIISAATLVAAVIFIFTGLSLEAWLAAVISLVIIKAGVDILREAISKIIGQRVDADLTHGIKETVCAVPGVLGAYDLVLNDYGPQRFMGSVHIEVDEDATARDIDRITRIIMREVYSKHGVVVHTVGVYSTHKHLEGLALKIHDDIDRITAGHKEVLQVHGFYVDEETKTINCDLVLDYDAKNRDEVYRKIVADLTSLYPEYHFSIVMDADISD